MRIFICIWTRGGKIRWKESGVCGVCLLLEWQNLWHFTRDESRAISMTLSNPDWSSEDHGLLYAAFVPGSSFKRMPERGDRGKKERGKIRKN